MTTRTRGRRASPATDELDRRITEAESSAIVMWAGERLPFSSVPQRVARIDDREERDGLYLSWLEAVEALNPLYQERFEVARDVALENVKGGAPRSVALDLEPFAIHTETPYYAALRRYLALIGIEQGDATEADLWHVEEGSTWNHWFRSHEVGRAASVLGGDASGGGPSGSSWREATLLLSGEPRAADPVVGAAIASARAHVAGNPEWVAGELGMAPEEVAHFVDFAAFMRLEAVRRSIGLLQYELRLYHADDTAVRRAYYSGVVGQLVGVAVPEAPYLRVVPKPFRSVRDLEVAMLAGMIGDRLEAHHGTAWWREPTSADDLAHLGDASSVEDAVARLGYDALDWRPVLRQIRTQLIGEMSGYGGPNITTRAGTRKV